MIKDSIKSKKSRHSLSFEKTSLDEARRLGLTQDPFHKNFLLGASEQRIGGGSEIAQGASSSGVQQPKQRKFFFELGTELIVYGRTEPDAEVWWGNKRINLRHDGTFGMRLALPDGKIPLDFVARSSDKMEQRSIVTAVERYKTVYNP